MIQNTILKKRLHTTLFPCHDFFLFEFKVVISKFFPVLTANRQSFSKSSALPRWQANNFFSLKANQQGAKSEKN